MIWTRKYEFTHISNLQTEASSKVDGMNKLSKLYERGFVPVYREPSSTDFTRSHSYPNTKLSCNPSLTLAYPKRYMLATMACHHMLTSESYTPMNTSESYTPTPISEYQGDVRINKAHYHGVINSPPLQQSSHLHPLTPTPFARRSCPSDFLTL